MIFHLVLRKYEELIDSLILLKQRTHLREKEMRELEKEIKALKKEKENARS